jgi:hypothetical protein
MREATRLPDVFTLLNDQLSSARGARTELRAQRAARYGLALANPDRPEDGWKLVSADRGAQGLLPHIDPSSLPRGGRSPR